VAVRELLRSAVGLVEELLGCEPTLGAVGDRLGVDGGVLRTLRALCERHLESLGAPLVFTSDAITLLHEHATGRLRDIDRVATDALKRAARRKSRQVDHQILEFTLAGDDDID